MSLRLAVTWPNARSPLIPDDRAGIDVLADGKRLTPTRSAVGERIFELPDGTAKVRLIASFHAKFGPVAGTEATSDVEAEVLHIDQKYDVKDGTRLEPEAIPAFVGPHPLAVTKGIAGTKGAVSIVLRTEFVDITPFWAKYATFWPTYEKEMAKENALRTDRKTLILPMGYTGGPPFIWFANFLQACQTSKNNEVSCLVFYRPANHYTFTRMDQEHEMVGLMRYLIAPLPDSAKSPDWWKLDHMTRDPHMHGRNLIRCGFEQALAVADRALVMLHPWPSGSDYGFATTNMLPSLCDSAIRYLWSRAVHWAGEEQANRFVCKGVENVRLGKLGLSGFSAGGAAVFHALKANARRVDELYLFDCNKTPAHAPEIAQWFTTAKRGQRLRMVGGAYNAAATRAIVKTICDIDKIAGPRTDLTAVLTEPDWFAAGKNAYWDHVLADVPEFRTHIDTQHQFAIFGGNYPTPDPAKKDPVKVEIETFLANFLKDSAFNLA